jgi:hypothetical protein
VNRAAKAETIAHFHEQRNQNKVTTSTNTPTPLVHRSTPVVCTLFLCTIVARNKHIQESGFYISIHGILKRCGVEKSHRLFLPQAFQCLISIYRTDQRQPMLLRTCLTYRTESGTKIHSLLYMYTLCREMHNLDCSIQPCPWSMSHK